MKKLTCLPFACILLFAGCSKDDSSDSTNPPTGGGSTSALSLTTPCKLAATIDGSAVSFTESATYEAVASSNKNINPPDPTTAIYGFGVQNLTTSTGVFGVLKGTLSFTGSSIADSNSFKSFFPVASYPYSVDGVNGVEFEYWINGVQWSTGYGSANQTGSTFTVTKRATGNLGYFAVKLNITFNCKIYDGNGHSKTISNGSMIAYFESN